VQEFYGSSWKQELIQTLEATVATQRSFGPQTEGASKLCEFSWKLELIQTLEATVATQRSSGPQTEDVQNLCEFSSEQGLADARGHEGGAALKWASFRRSNEIKALL